MDYEELGELVGVVDIMSGVCLGELRVSGYYLLHNVWGLRVRGGRYLKGGWGITLQGERVYEGFLNILGAYHLIIPIFSTYVIIWG